MFRQQNVERKRLLLNLIAKCNCNVVVECHVQFFFVIPCVPDWASSPGSVSPFLLLIVLQFLAFLKIVPTSAQQVPISLESLIFFLLGALIIQQN